MEESRRVGVSVVFWRSPLGLYHGMWGRKWIISTSNTVPDLRTIKGKLPMYGLKCNKDTALHTNQISIKFKIYDIIYEKTLIGNLVILPVLTSSWLLVRLCLDTHLTTNKTEGVWNKESLAKPCGKKAWPTSIDLPSAAMTNN